VEEKEEEEGGVLVEKEESRLLEQCEGGLSPVVSFHLIIFYGLDTHSSLTGAQLGISVGLPAAVVVARGNHRQRTPLRF
jgi:hypothetical protein